MDCELLHRKVEEYHFVDSMLTRLKKRRDELNGLIKQALLKDHPLTAEDTIEYNPPGYEVTLTARRSKLDIDEYALQDFLISKGIWEVCKKEVADRDMVKQFFINGSITDQELRELIEHKDPQAALTVRAVKNV